MKITSVSRQPDIKTAAQILQGLSGNTVSVELTEFELLVLGRITGRIGGVSEAREASETFYRNTRAYFKGEQKYDKLEAAFDELFTMQSMDSAGHIENRPTIYIRNKVED